jgi:putative two-component system response regulator
MGGYAEDCAVAALAEGLALRRGYSPKASRQLRIAARLHDIGKQYIPARLLCKRGELTACEMEIIKTHTTLGAELLAGVQGEIGGMVRAVCLYHHEWHDGGGYWGKCAGDIPAYVPLVAIADVYMALTTARPYKTPWPRAAALDYLRQRAGTQFSRELVDEFHALIAATSGQVVQK